MYSYTEADECAAKTELEVAQEQLRFASDWIKNFKSQKRSLLSKVQELRLLKNSANGEAVLLRDNLMREKKKNSELRRTLRELMKQSEEQTKAATSDGRTYSSKLANRMRGMCAMLLINSVSSIFSEI